MTRPEYALARLVLDKLKELGLSRRRAAELTGLPISTIDAMTRRGGRYVGKEAREGLERLGIPHELVEYAAAVSAGFDVSPSETARELSAQEWRAVFTARGLPASVRNDLYRLIESAAQATGPRRPDDDEVMPA
jgi:hypothetical protein